MEKELAEKLKEIELRLAAIEKNQEELASYLLPLVPKYITDLPDELKETPLQELGLSEVIVKRLTENNIKKLGDLSGVTIDDLLKIKNVGGTKVAEVRYFYERYGFCFPSEQIKPATPWQKYIRRSKSLLR
jgi:DNA-directed RNA polymerase alpha subunit